MGQPKLFSVIDKAVYEYNLIENGDKILIGASGGKDSTALVEYFAYRKKQNRTAFDLRNSSDLRLFILHLISPNLWTTAWFPFSTAGM